MANGEIIKYFPDFIPWQPVAAPSQELLSQGNGNTQWQTITGFIHSQIFKIARIQAINAL